MLINGYEIKHPPVRYGKINSDISSNWLVKDNDVPLIKFWMIKSDCRIAGINQFLVVLDIQPLNVENIAKLLQAIHISNEGKVVLFYVNESFVKESLIAKVYHEKNKSQIIEAKDVPTEYLTKIIDEIIKYLENKEVVKKYMFQFKNYFQVAYANNSEEATQMILQKNTDIHLSDINYIELMDYASF